MTDLPKTFRVGASTAAYQIEGAAQADGRGPSIWDVFCRKPGAIETGETGDVACDHYRRYPEDIALMAEAGFDTYRFSVSWSRVLPEGRGAVNRAGLDFYDRLVDALLAARIEPWLCLYHWDLPQALEARGGWPNRDLVGWFGDYAALIAGRFGDRVPMVHMFNEPSIFTWLGYELGLHAPGRREPEAARAATHHVNLATARGIDAVRAEAPATKVGTIVSLTDFQPVSDAPASVRAAELARARMHGAFLDPLFHGRYPDELAAAFAPHVQEGDLAACRRTIDLLGVNYYTRALVGPGAPAFGSAPAGARTTAMGWEIHPDGLRTVLLEVKDRYGNPPVCVTESGGAFPDPVAADGRVYDHDRVEYLHDHVAACLRALEAGCDVRGYLVWSLLDNFEWTKGYAKRFGIVHVDYASGRRTPKLSHAWMTRLARERRLPPPR